MEDNELFETEIDPAWKKFEREFLKKPGEHLFGVGRTGSGKTQKAYYIAGKLSRFETVAWMDTGKTMLFGSKSELTPLFSLGKPIHIVHPYDCSINVTGSPVPVTTFGILSPEGIWEALRPGCINIVSVAPFFIEPDLYSKYLAKAFKSLIRYTNRNPEKIHHILPLSIFMDEFQDLAPGRDMTLSTRHRYNGILLTFNVNKLRSPGIRICAFTQSDTMVMRNARSAFSWILCCRGADISRTNQISHYNNLYAKLDVNQAILWYPNREFEGRWRFPLIPSPDGLTIEHDGLIEELEEEPKKLKLPPALEKKLMANQIQG